MPKLAIAATLALAALVQSPHAHAQAYPTRQVQVICALGAGTGVDITARLYSERLQKRFGQPFVVENRPGGAQMVAVDSVKKAAPDGYTLGVFTSAAMAIRPTMMKKATYDPVNDFIPVAQYLKSAFVLVVNPDLPIKSIADLVKYVKSQPGKVGYAISSIGGAPHLAGEFLAIHLGIPLAAVPYKQSPQAFQDVAAGHIPLSFADAGTALPLITSGKLRALAVTTLKRTALLPDVGSVAELAIPNFEATAWHALVGPANLPKDVLATVHKAMMATLKDPATSKQLTGLGLDIMPTTPEELAAYVKAEIPKWTALIKASGATLE
jgi:tripartite-type tricarboxylate transporter receptor subunit TctC